MWQYYWHKNNLCPVDKMFRFPVSLIDILIEVIFCVQNIFKSCYVHIIWLVKNCSSFWQYCELLFWQTHNCRTKRYSFVCIFFPLLQKYVPKKMEHKTKIRTQLTSKLNCYKNEHHVLLISLKTLPSTQ